MDKYILENENSAIIIRNKGLELSFTFDDIKVMEIMIDDLINNKYFKKSFADNSFIELRNEIFNDYDIKNKEFVYIGYCEDEANLNINLALPYIEYKQEFIDTLKKIKQWLFEQENNEDEYAY